MKREIKYRECSQCRGTGMVTDLRVREKFSEAQIDEMIKLYQGGMLLKDIANKFGLRGGFSVTYQINKRLATKNKLKK